MECTPTSLPLYALKHRAKQRARLMQIPLHQALDEMAQQQGFAQWSLLLARRAQHDSVAAFAPLHPGQLMLLAARPLQGKTWLGFRWLRQGQHAAFFSLDCTPTQVQQLMATADADAALWQTRFSWDCSDDICAAYVQHQLRDAAPQTLVVIDYLQLLDQRRSQPPLAQQLAVLRHFAQQRQLRVVLIAQIKRSFDAGAERMPGWHDVRLPNPVDAQLFDQCCFVHQGRMRMQ